MSSPTVWWSIAVLFLSLWLIALLSGLPLGLAVHALLVLAIAFMTVNAVRVHGHWRTVTRSPRW